MKSKPYRYPAALKSIRTPCRYLVGGDGLFRKRQADHPRREQLFSLRPLFLAQEAYLVSRVYDSTGPSSSGGSWYE